MSRLTEVGCYNLGANSPYFGAGAAGTARPRDTTKVRLVMFPDSTPILDARAIARFWSKVDQSPGQGPKGDCWEWTGAIQSGGYGTVNLGGKGTTAHRLALILATGEPPTENLDACHECDNPPCCNPAHLFWGTRRENANDSARKGRHGTRVHPERWRRGEAHPHHKLAVADVVDIRLRAAAGEQLTRIAADKHVTKANVSLIVKRRAWRHVA